MSQVAVQESRPGSRVEHMALRKASSAFPTGVTIVSTLTSEGIPCGLTVNSFTTVSLDPPLVSWSLKSTSPSLDHFDAATTATINILAHEQSELALRFARPVANKFEGVATRATPGGAPAIEGCLAYFECRPWSRVEAGDHILYIWEVVDLELNTLDAPLTFHAGGFRQLLT